MRVKLLHARYRNIETNFRPGYFYRRKEEQMSKVIELEKAIESLDEAEYIQLRRWFSERDWDKWDRQIETDSDAGKLDFLVREALEEKRKGKLGEL